MVKIIHISIIFYLISIKLNITTHYGKKIHVILHMEIAGSKYVECLMLCIWYLIHTHTTNTCCVPTF